MRDLPVITDRRKLDLDGMRWTITKFEDGRHILHVDTSNGATNFNTHFTAQGWFDFQELIANP